jgi:GNAT superfamily N-acetyltransferase
MLPIFEPGTHVTKLTGAEDTRIYGQIGALHRRQLAAGALAHFPDRFLATFYRYLARRDDCVVFVMEKQDQVIGFVAGTLRSSGLLTSFAMEFPVEMMRSSILLMFELRLLGRIISLLFFMVTQAKRSHFGGCQLLSIAVASDNERAGVGSALFVALCRWFRSFSVTSFEIIAATTQVSALQFYKRHGAIEIERAVLGGLESLILVYVL